MLLLHQSGALKVGEIARYTLTYTPALDRILPAPTHLHVKIKNASAIPLRAAYLHGPYTLYVSVAPSTFDANAKFERQEEEGTPDYEPQLKAGGNWSAKLKVPKEIRQDIENGVTSRDDAPKSFTWIVEIASQVLFSKTAAVNYELLVGRDEKSIASRITGAISINSDHGMPGKLEDLQQHRGRTKVLEPTKGVFSKALKVVVEDTESLWNLPPLPSWDANDDNNADRIAGMATRVSSDLKPPRSSTQRSRKQKKVHLVVLTHGLHSNLGADMLYMKESIDAAAAQAREDARRQREQQKVEAAKRANEFGRPAQGVEFGSAPDIHATDISDAESDDEQVIVRGFNGNAIRTERGIQYLGKRLSKYVLSITYPDQPYLPVKSSLTRNISRTLTGAKEKDKGRQNEQPEGLPSHRNSSIVRTEKHTHRDLPYRITSISFVGHSLGGLVQTYAVAYIQKHSPDFFDRIRPVNFVAMATPFLGLSNENPMYVKFALDFGLVGRTGQDLGLTWRAPTIARNSWGAMVNGLVNDPHKDRQPDPGTKPLLRILPTGPAHNALKRFQNRTVYSNVVNDGIVPLRTSCLLFLDWRGLDRVEKARRDNGLIGTMVNWGWNEMMGGNASSPRRPLDFLSDNADSSSAASEEGGSSVPQPEVDQGLEYENTDGTPQKPNTLGRHLSQESTSSSLLKNDVQEHNNNAWYAFLNYFKPQAGQKPRKELPRSKRIYSRGQTMKFDDNSDDSSVPDTKADQPARKSLVRGSSLYTNNSEGDGLEAPPKTTVFESAGDLLNPPLPPKDFLLDPAARPRTIFHDRVYHPDDIPPPPAKRQKTFMRFNSSRSDVSSSSVPNQVHGDLDRISNSKSEEPPQGNMRIEEKIARAYHKDMSWRKVLVRLEPDAHNNMIVRRMFANAYGWPVVKHMCDTHFAFTAAATTPDDNEKTGERAKPHHETAGDDGEEVRDQVKPPEQPTTAESERDDHRRHTIDVTNDIQREKRPDQRTTAPRAMHNKIIDEEKHHSAIKRSPSEARESRDKISDLVSHVTATGETSSSYGNMHSGSLSSNSSATANLYRLSRVDSARWSDRYFEGTDDEWTDDELDSMYRSRKSIDENEQAAGRRRSSLNKQSNSSNILEDTIVSSELVREPEGMSPTTESKAGRTNSEDSDQRTSSLTGVGLGANIQEHVATSPTASASDKGQGIAEQVALAQGHGSKREKHIEL